MKKDSKRIPTPAPRRNKELTRDDLLSELDYDEENGLFRWKRNQGHRGPRAGTVAGYTYPDAPRVIRIFGFSHSARKLILLVHTGTLDNQYILSINGEIHDDRFVNLRWDDGTRTLDRSQVDFAIAEQMLSYDPVSGVLRWRVARAKSGRVGDIAGTLRDDGYYGVCIGTKPFMAHRLAWLLHYGHWPTQHIDHIDGKKTNNAISNLRLATVRENSWNVGLSRRNRSGRKGVGWSKSKSKFRARININGKEINLGYFATLEAAGDAHDAKARELHGEFANELVRSKA